MNRLQVMLTVVGLTILLVGSTIAHGETLAVTGATIIDGTGTKPVVNGSVLMVDGRIKAVGKAGDVDMPAGVKTIDAKGKYVIPGLMDANLHLFLNIDLETLIKYEGRYHEIILEAAQIALKTGQTTVFDTWGPLAPLVQVRDQINRGEVPGSRIFLAGNIIGFGGPLSQDFKGESAKHVSKAFAKRINTIWEVNTGRELAWLGPEEMRNVIREYTTTGVDFLKYGASGHTLDEMQFISYSPRVQQAIVSEAHKAGLTVQTHTSSPESLDMAVNAGVDILTHCGGTGPAVPILDSTLQKMADRQIPCSVLAITQRRLDAIIAAGPDRFYTKHLKIRRINIRKMIEAGVPLLLSTDAGIANPVLLAEAEKWAAADVDPRTTLGEGHFNALVALQEMGMAPMEILKTATSNIAKAYKVDAELGTLEVGKAADLVILDKNPLDDAKNYRQINMVIKSGRSVNLDVLPQAPIISSMAAEK